MPDSPDNVRFEKDGGDGKKGAPVVKGGTLVKLVERLTYPQYTDNLYPRQFLVTFRSFATPAELMACLFARYRVPELPGNKFFLNAYATVVKLRCVAGAGGLKATLGRRGRYSPRARW